MTANGVSPPPPDDDYDDRDFTADEIDTMLAAFNPQVLATNGDLLRFIDWSEFWDKERSADEWTYPEVFARGRGHALYAMHKAGKSLFTLWVCAELAAGPDPVAVVYLDYEMTEDDLRDRLEDMGYGPDRDLSRFHYALLPSLPPLDGAYGAETLAAVLDGVALEHPDHHLFVVIDTTSRAVTGEENDADTYQAFYRHTGMMLKRRGVTWVRLDHAGKDPGKGQRGSSAKGDDVDIVWKLSPEDNGVILKRELTRISWAKEKVSFVVTNEPLRYVAAKVWAAGTAEVAQVLDDLNVPVEASGNQAMTMLQAAGQGHKRAVVLDAVRYRRDGA